ncbi:hypothetical protein [Bradyrhizobium yuanmingense]|uniref:hypothetical protein n=1 Tax=Bradyrhizobium yuanmingense TaxID=108015 RepID=UPI001CD5F3D3|nr:hypothetical protein [Bradyrhizobium yuanmingense]MCA1529734.1 hypothetical protein [Bradyrhizobium yuanmingense]
MVHRAFSWIIIDMAKDPHGKPLQRLALELGYISIYWGWLEDAIDSLITQLAPLEEGHAANAITGSTDLRSKIQMARALAFIRKGESQGWYEAVISNLNVIDNDIRGRRNVYVHSPWFVPKGRLVRHKKSAKISKAQAFQPLTLTTLEVTPVRIAEARKLKADMLKALQNVVYQLSFAIEIGWYTSRNISFEESARWQKLALKSGDARKQARRMAKSQRATSADAPD